MRQLKKSEYVLSAVFVLTAMFPLATASNEYQVGLSLTGSAAEFRREAFSNRTDLRKQLIECRAKLRDGGTTVECDGLNPSLNGKIFLRTGVRPVQSTGATAEERVRITVDDLSTRNQSLLRRFVRSNACPATLNALLPGFYELCLSVTREKGPLPRGFLNDRVKRAFEENADAPTLEQRIEMFEGMRPDR